MIIASAQTNPTRENIDKNLNDHYSLIKLAVDNNVQLIIFPEMSVTGYERKLAEKQAFMENDSRLDKLGDLSVKNNMIIVVGAPIKMDSGLYIGSFVLLPNGKNLIYTKQFLHSGEEEYFSSSFDYNPIIKLENEKISLAICADIDNPLHSENAYKNKATIYSPSIFFSSNGVNDAHKMLSEYASKYSMNILMSNFCGESWDMQSGGKSAFWNQKGELIASLDNKSTGLLIATKKNDIWNGKAVTIK